LFRIYDDKKGNKIKFAKINLCSNEFCLYSINIVFCLEAESFLIEKNSSVYVPILLIFNINFYQTHDKMIDCKRLIMHIIKISIDSYK
jgi:hypothetical protein